MSENTTPTPTKSMIFFFVISILYLILNIYNITSCSSIEHVVENSNNNIFIIAYVIILIIGMYFINLNISKEICNNSDSIDYNSVFFSTFLPWIIIFGILYFLLEIFSGWVRPFSNTIGYFIVNLLGAEKVLKEMLNNNDSSVKKAIEKIDNNTSEFINEFDIRHTEYIEFIKKLQAENITTSSALNPNSMGKNEIELFKLINIKHLIGKIIWYFLAGTLIASISFNNIINQQCDKTVKSTSAEIQQLYNEEDEEYEEDI